MPADGLSTDQQAEALRQYLIRAIDTWFESAQQEYGPDAASEQIEQVILRKKYAEGLSRTEVERYLYDTVHVAITGGAYSRHLTLARQHLADVIVDHELAHITAPQ